MSTNSVSVNKKIGGEQEQDKDKDKEFLLLRTLEMNLKNKLRSSTSTDHTNTDHFITWINNDDQVIQNNANRSAHH